MQKIALGERAYDFMGELKPKEDYYQEYQAS